LSQALDMIRNAGITLAVEKSIQSGRMDVGNSAFGIMNLQYGCGFRLDMQLSLQGKPQFLITAKANVGHANDPLIITIDEMSGAAWLEAMVQYDAVAGHIVTENSGIVLGLAAGTVTGATLIEGAVSGYVSILFGVEIIYRPPGSGEIAVTLTIHGSVRIISFINADILLQLVAKQTASGMGGSGELTVSIPISFFYTFNYSGHVDKASF
jgi:hypothetical protein